MYREGFTRLQVVSITEEQTPDTVLEYGYYQSLLFLIMDKM